MDTELDASHGSVKDIKEKIMKDLQGVIDDANNQLKAMSHSTAEEFATARAKIEEQLGKTKSRLGDARTTLTEKAKSAANATQEYVKENPRKVTGFAVAAAAGLIVGILLRRR